MCIQFTCPGCKTEYAITECEKRLNREQCVVVIKPIHVCNICIRRAEEKYNKAKEVYENFKRFNK